MHNQPAMDPTAAANASRHFGPRFLKIYDPVVLGFYCRFVWRCPTPRIVQHYGRHLRRRHLDVGPGTGYFLKRAQLPGDATVLLLDPNPAALAHASRRLAYLRPSVLQADVCQPLPLNERFDSIALNYVLHCLPGPMARKAAAIRNVAAVLEPDGVLFGATVLGAPELHTWLSRAALGETNRRGVFDNLSDTEGALRAALTDSFADVTIEIVGSVAVFTAEEPRQAFSGPARLGHH